MAKPINMLTTTFYSLMIVLAFNYIAIAGFLYWQWYSENVSSEELVDVAKVVMGEKKYAFSLSEIEEYRRLKEAEAAREKALAVREGMRETRARSAESLQAAEELLRERERMSRTLIEEEEQRLKALRKEIEDLKKQADEARANLTNQQVQLAKADMAARTEKVERVFKTMEPELIAQFIAAQANQAGLEDAVRMLLDYVPPNTIAEVFGAMDVQTVRQILPQMENKYAAMPPAQVVKLWTTPGTNHYAKSPKEMAEYLRYMPVPKAFSIIRQLDPKKRAELAQHLHSLASQ